MPKALHPDEGSEQTVIRLQPGTLKRCDDLIEFIANRRGLSTGNRSDVLREAIARGLKQLEREKKKES